ncbi:MAG: rhombosortase [Gammaproteobacteria bacterium]
MPPLMRQSYHNIAIVLVAIVLAVLEPRASHYLQFDRSAILQAHEYSRVLTGNFVHLSPAHVIMNVVGLSLVVLIFLREQKPWRDTLVFLLIAIVSSLLMLNFSPHILRYVGLSGIIHGYFVYYLAVGAEHTPRLCLIGWLGTLTKVTLEQLPHYDGSSTAALIGGEVAYDAHQFGFLCGSLIGIILLIWRFRHRNTNK